MKYLFLLVGIITVILSTFYIIIPDNSQIFNFKDVFAQSDGDNKNFENGETTPSSETSPKLKTKIKNFQGNFSNNTDLSHSSETSTTIENTNKDKKSIIGRLSTEHTKIHPAITQIFEHADPKAMAKI